MIKIQIQVVEVMQLIFESSGERYPTVAELVRCDLFQHVELREMRGASVSVKRFFTPKFIFVSMVRFLNLTICFFL